MATSQPTRPRVAAVWRPARRAVAVLRAIHDEQVLMWELFWQSTGAAVDWSGPLAWQASLDGPRLIGSHLPTRKEAAGTEFHRRIAGPAGVSTGEDMTTEDRRQS
jgi:hypothetical protein